MKRRTLRKRNKGGEGVKGLTSLAVKVLMVLAVILSNSYTGLSSLSQLDKPLKAEASTDVWTYNFTAVYERTSSGPAITDDSKLVAFKRNENSSFVIDFSSNTFTVNKFGWAFGYESPDMYSYGTNNNTFFTNASSMNTIDNYTRNYSSSHYVNRYFNVGTNGLNITGSNFFKNNLVVGSTIPFTSFYNVIDRYGMDNAYPTVGYLVINSIVKGSSSGSCGTPSSPDQWTYNFTAVTERTSGYSVPMNDPSKFTSYTLNEKSNFVIDYSTNKFKVTKLGWAFGYESPDLYSYGVNNNTYFSNTSSMNTIANYSSGFSTSHYSNRYFNSLDNNTLNITGANYFKNQLVVGSTVPFTSFYTGMRNGRESVYTTIGYLSIDSIQKGGTSGPCEITCPVGTTKVGTGTTAYCEKPKYITSCPTGMTLVGSGASAFCRQNVETKNDLNINLGDITNNLNNSGFGGSTNHNSSLVVNGGNGNSNQTVNNLSGKDNNFVNFTNVPTDGKVTAMTNTWKPEFTVTYKGKILKAPKPTDASQLQQHNLALSEFTSQAGDDNGTNHTTVEAVLYKVSSVKELTDVTKDKNSLISIFDKQSNGEYVKKEQIKYASVSKKGLENYENFTTNNEGLYLLATKYVDQTKTGSLADKTTYTFKPLEITFLNTAGYLPISNYLTGQVNDIYMSVGMKKKDHGLTDLNYKEYKSMKVPSAYNYSEGVTLLGSTNGGIKLMSDKLEQINITNSTAVDLDKAKVYDIIEMKQGFFFATDKGVFCLDVPTKTVKATSITYPTLDIEHSNDVLVTLSEDTLRSYFTVGYDLLPSVNEYDLTGLFSANKKPGRFEMLGDSISVSTVDLGSESEVIVLASK